MIQNLTGNIWNCEDKYGYFCYAPVKCEAFNGDEHASYDLSDYDFKIAFSSNDKTYLRIPLLSLMRNSQAVDSQCNMLIYYLDPARYQSSEIVLGSAFLMNFFA